MAMAVASEIEWQAFLPREWMISQLKEARARELEREEYGGKRAALARKSGRRNNFESLRTSPRNARQYTLALRYKFANRPYAERSASPEQLIGRPITEIMGEEAYEQSGLRGNRLQGRPVEYEVEIPYQRVGRRFMSVAYVPEKDPAGERDWMVGVAQRHDRPETN